MYAISQVGILLPPFYSIQLANECNYRGTRTALDAIKGSDDASLTYKQSLPSLSSRAQREDL